MKKKQTNFVYNHFFSTGEQCNKTKTKSNMGTAFGGIPNISRQCLVRGH